MIKESSDVILARIDERVNNLLLSISEFKSDLSKHKEEDAKELDSIKKNMWMGIGGLTVLVFIIKLWK